MVELAVEAAITGSVRQVLHAEGSLSVRSLSFISSPGRFRSVGSPANPAQMKLDLLLPQNAHEQIETLAKELLGTCAPWLTGIVPRTALAVLWLVTHGHEVESMVAQGLVEAAGLRRKQALESPKPFPRSNAPLVTGTVSRI